MARKQVKPPTCERKPCVPFTDELREQFLVEYAKSGRQAMSAISVGLHPDTVSHAKTNDPAFKAACEGALELYREKLVKEAERRAHDGVEEPVFYKGEECGTIQRYSDMLLLALLKRHIPEFRDRHQVDVTHSGGVMVVAPRDTDDNWEKQYGAGKAD